MKLFREGIVVLSSTVLLGSLLLMGCSKSADTENKSVSTSTDANGTVSHDHHTAQSGQTK